jgi:hypothetical protein
MTTSERSSSILNRKFAALQTAVTPWLNAVHEHKKFPRMTSQTAAAVDLLHGVLAGIEGAIAAGTLAAPAIENRILGGYQFWNVFRYKFAQRFEDPLERFLKAADELAWLCYRPARNAALGADDPKAKEPPLVYFSNEASPFIDPRGDRFQPEGMPEYLIKSYGWPEASRRQPFAMIGVPWFQLGFLPGALAIAHEVGHSVEGDFALAGSLDSLIETAAPARTATWKAWRGEMFADLWGCLALGPAFVSALAETIWPPYAADPDSTSREYPPAPLRIWWNSQVLENMHLPAKMTDFWPAGETTAGDQDLRDDAGRIAKAWLDASFPELGNSKMRAVLNFTEEQRSIAGKQAESAKDNESDAHRNVLTLWAAVQEAWQPKPVDLLLTRIIAACDLAERAAPRATPAQPSTAAARADHIRDTGRDLFL